MPEFTGVMVVLNQAETVDLAIESVAPFVEEFHVVDNGSEDRTRDVVEETLDRLDLPGTVETRREFPGEIVADLINEKAEDYAIRVEGDQIFYRDRLRGFLDSARRGTTVHGASVLLQNRYDRQNVDYPTNPAHAMIYDARAGVQRIEGKIWPIHRGSDSFPYDEPVSINARVNRPLFRLLRWHRTGGYGTNLAYWNRYDGTEVPEDFRVPEVDPPYRDKFTEREYARLLRERGKGTAGKWEGDTLPEVAEAFVEWDTHANTVPYEGDYPDLLEQRIENHGYEPRL